MTFCYYKKAKDLNLIVGFYPAIQKTDILHVKNIIELKFLIFGF